MEGHVVTIRVRAKNAAAAYTERLFTHETDVQQVKYLYHKYTHENHSDVDGAEGSHTLHINGTFPQEQRLLNIEPVDSEELESYKNDGLLPIDFI